MRSTTSTRIGIAGWRRFPITLLGVLLSAGHSWVSYAAAETPLEGATQPASQTAGPGQALFQQRCSHCHEGGYPRAPHASYLRMMTPRSIYSVLTEGAMRPMAEGLSLDEKQQIAEYLTGKKLADEPAEKPQLECHAKDWFKVGEPGATGWGFDERNSRFIPASIAGLSPAQIPRLKLKWAFAFPNAQRARSQPAIAGGALFVGSQDGRVYALDARSGCKHWAFQAAGEVRTAIAVSVSNEDTAASKSPKPSVTLYFGDFFATVYAVDGLTGQLRWKRKIEEHPTATITGSPTLSEGKLFVPLSSLGAVDRANPKSSCCTNRGAMVALDASSGELLWKTYVIPNPAVEQYRNAAGVPQFGPAGASVWDAPTVDARRHRLYFGTGQNHVAPVDDNSDAIFALDTRDGHVIWKHQAVRDFWPADPHSPDSAHENHLDADFSVSPILISVKNGNEPRDILVAGQKSGDVYAFDPDSGEVRWHIKPGRGGVKGGVHFGMAAQGRTVFVPVFDADFGLSSISPPLTAPAQPAVHALDAATGKRIWVNRLQDQCQPSTACQGYSAAITAIPGAVFAGRYDGTVQALDSRSGKVLWSFDTARGFQTLNGDTARGNSLDGPGPVIVDGMVYANSGYGIYGGLAGNVLLAFSVDGH